MGGGGDFGSGSGSKFNCAARVGSGQTISGTGRVRASVLSPCRPLKQIQRDAENSYCSRALRFICFSLETVSPEWKFLNDYFHVWKLFRE